MPQVLCGSGVERVDRHHLHRPRHHGYGRARDTGGADSFRRPLRRRLRLAPGRKLRDVGPAADGRRDVLSCRSRRWLLGGPPRRGRAGGQLGCSSPGGLERCRSETVGRGRGSWRRPSSCRLGRWPGAGLCRRQLLPLGLLPRAGQRRSLRGWRADRVRALRGDHLGPRRPSSGHGARRGRAGGHTAFRSRTAEEGACIGRQGG
mmetsp:Transcript_14119/g.31993  ORF Transcript_14119/g.31993 Transcript_14119/m.31993 type:complete len:204 (+) Transcript_14119:209-820(+)